MPDSLQIYIKIIELSQYLGYNMCHSSTDQGIGISFDEIGAELRATQKFNPLRNNTRFPYPHKIILS
ncbi:unnamed protein product [marine sediment metagenome]|uniref:Uncharacterized protein n=1 Tax=marine sediment metagenome TaxID=412755 RepID=X0V6P0_9ZZZZ